VLAVFAVSLIIVRPLAMGKGKAEAVQVELAGHSVRQIALLPSGRRVIIPLSRGSAVLSFEHGGVRIMPMPRPLCPRQICSHGGLIRLPGETLVCAPNRLIVRVLSGESAVDAVAR